MVFHGMMGKPQNGTDQIQLTAASSHLRLEPGEQVSGVLPGTAIRTFSAQEHRALGLLSVRSSKHFTGWQDLKLNGAEHESASLSLLFLQKNPMRVICERLHPASSGFIRLHLSFRCAATKAAPARRSLSFGRPGTASWTHSRPPQGDDRNISKSRFRNTQNTEQISQFIDNL